MVQTDFRAANRVAGESGTDGGTAPDTAGTPTAPRRHGEGPIAYAIEQQTARIPSDMYLWASFASMGASLWFQYAGDRDRSLFVGQWAPTFLLLGLYNKIVKVSGSDRVRAS